MFDALGGKIGLEGLSWDLATQETRSFCQEVDTAAYRLGSHDLPFAQCIDTRRGNGVQKRDV